MTVKEKHRSRDTRLMDGKQQAAGLTLESAATLTVNGSNNLVSRRHCRMNETA